MLSIGLLAGSLVLATAAEPAADQAGKEEQKEEPAIEIPIEKGVPVRGIKVPHYGEDGQLRMMFDADVAQKVDDTHIAMEKLKIDVYNDDGKKLYVELPKAIFDTDTRVLTGDESIIIRREDFEITGDAGDFNTKTRFAKVLGNVKMTIYDTSDINQ